MFSTCNLLILPLRHGHADFEKVPKAMTFLLALATIQISKVMCKVVLIMLFSLYLDGRHAAFDAWLLDDVCIVSGHD